VINTIRDIIAIHEDELSAGLNESCLSDIRNFLAASTNNAEDYLTYYAMALDELNNPGVSDEEKN
jgi:hypothetical protein